MNFKPKPIPKDAKISSGGGEFASVPNGVYTATGFTIITINKQDNSPILVNQNMRDGRSLQVLRLSFQTEQDHEPPISLQIGETKNVALAFGVDLSQLGNIPPLNNRGALSMYLANFEKVCNEQGTKTPQVRVKNGWVNLQDISGANPPKSIYSWQAVGLTSNDGLPFQSKKFDDNYFFLIDLELIGDMHGNPNVYTGMRNTQFVTYDLSLSEDGIMWAMTKDGKYTLNSQRFCNLLEVAAPSFFQINGLQDTRTILPEVEDALLKDKKIWCAASGVNDNGNYQVQLETMTSLNNDNVSPVDTIPPQQKNTVDHLDIVRQLFMVLGEDKAVFTTGLEVTDWGKSLLKKHLGPLKQNGTIPKSISHLSQLSKIDVVNVLNSIEVENLPDDKAESVQSLLNQILDSDDTQF